MQGPDANSKPTRKARRLLEKKFKVDLSRLNEDLIYNHFRCFQNSLSNMTGVSKNTSNYETSCDVIKELYKMTPLKKRPMLKPTKKIIAAAATSTARPEPESTIVSEFQPETIYAPVSQNRTETSSSPADEEVAITEAVTEITSTPMEMESTSAPMEMESTSAPEKPRKPRKPQTPTKKGSKKLKKNMTQQEIDDYNLAKVLQAAEFNLRERTPRKSSQPIIKPKTEPIEMDSIPTERRKSRKYGLSPALANVIGRKEMRPERIMRKMYAILKKKNMLSADGNNVDCDVKLSKKLFSGKRRFPVSDMMGLLRKHMIYVV